MKSTGKVSRRRVLQSLVGIPLAGKLHPEAWAAEAPERGASNAGKDRRPETKHIQAFCIDFNWKRGVFAPPGWWANADPKAHASWYAAAGVNTIQTFCVSCNGYAWYKGGKIPAQPGLKYDFLSDVRRRGHDHGQRVMGYFCAAANSRWQKLHPVECYQADAHRPTIVFTKRYLEYLDSAITEALALTGIDGFMVDWLWTPDGPCKWLDCEKQMYDELFGSPFPGKDKIDAEEELAFKRRSIGRCWAAIRSAAKRHNPDVTIWLSCNNPSNPSIGNSIVFDQVDWLMNENPDPHTWEQRGRIGRHTKLLQCVVGWGERDNAIATLRHPPLGIENFYGFSAPGTDSLPLPVETYLQHPISSFHGNDKNIATLIRYFRGLPFPYIQGKPA